MHVCFPNFDFFTFYRLILFGMWINNYFTWLIMKFPPYFLQRGRQWIVGFVVCAFARAGNRVEEFSVFKIFPILIICNLLFLHFCRLRLFVKRYKRDHSFQQYYGNISYCVFFFNFVLDTPKPIFTGEGTERLEGRVQHCGAFSGKTWELGFSLFFLLFFL